MDSTLHHDPFAPDDAIEREPWEQQLSGEPVRDYDQGNAKNIIIFLAAAPLPIAERVLAYEAAHDNRKTVIDAAKARVEELNNNQEEPMLPAGRLQGAGATPAEIGQLTLEYEESAPEAQKSLTDHLTGISEGDIRTWLEDLREQGHFSEDGEAPQTPEGDSVALTEEQQAYAAELAALSDDELLELFTSTELTIEGDAERADMETLLVANYVPPGTTPQETAEEAAVREQNERDEAEALAKAEAAKGGRGSGSR